MISSLITDIIKRFRVKYANLIWLVAISLFVAGCEDKSMVNIYDKSITKNPPKCLRLSVIPPHPQISKKLKDMYKFDPACQYTLEVKYKNNIHCTSNQNSQRKALSAFPSSFLSMDIRKGMRVVYSYYIDLTSTATADDAENGIERIMEDLKLD